MDDDIFDEEGARLRAQITAQVDDAMYRWQWLRDEEVKDFPPAVQEFLLKDWEPGKL